MLQLRRVRMRRLHNSLQPIVDFIQILKMFHPSLCPRKGHFIRRILIQQTSQERPPLWERSINCACALVYGDLRARHPQRAFLRKGSKTVGPMSLIYGM
jgi:hypothetical protein